MNVKYLGLADYLPVFEAMKHFTETRTDDTVDELWIVEHPQVFTQGQVGKPEHILNVTEIPIVRVDRGGQVTFHGPGQLVVYTLINFKKRKIGIRSLVRSIEASIIDTLGDYGIEAYGKEDAPGVYVAGDKIASLGLRIKNGAVYHGLALNVKMDLTPFTYINPCGYAGLKMTQMADLIANEVVHQLSVNQVAERLVNHLKGYLGEID